MTAPAGLRGQRSDGERPAGVHALGANGLAVAGTEASDAQLADHSLRLEHVHQLADEGRAAAAGAVDAAVCERANAVAEDRGSKLTGHASLFGAGRSKPSARTLRPFWADMYNRS